MRGPLRRRVKILSGVSGSGKSAIARKLWNELEAGTYCKVVSADNFFMAGGRYNFDPTKLGQAHSGCFRSFIEALQDDYKLVVVDNTNTTVQEIAPYILGAEAYDWDVEILTVMCHTEYDVKVCAWRNTHGTTLESIQGMHRRLSERMLPPWWKNTTVGIGL